MNYYSVPSDFKKETIDQYEALNKQYDDGMVLETYGSITSGKVLASGRLVRQMQKIDFLDLYEYIKYSSERGIGFNYTLNPTHFQNREFTEEGVKTIKEHLHKLYEAGVRSVTVTMPSLTELVQSTGLDIKIRTSCLSQIRNANRAMAYKEMGVDKIVVDESINRDFHALKSIRQVFGEKVEIIVNQICDQNCMYRLFHYNMISGDPDKLTSQVSINYYEHRCVLQQLKTIDNCLKLCWVRPEDIHYYEDIGINYFKIQGRHAFIQGGDAVKTVKAYLDRSYDGNLMDLLMMLGDLTKFKVNLDNKKLDGYIKPFVENDRFCRHNCGQCRYCENFLRKQFDVKEIEGIQHMAREFLGEYDQYKKLLGSVKREEIHQVPTDINADFDL
jgi:collagenase-like PrtC family protease